MLKKYTRPLIELHLIDLESSIASSSAIVSPLGLNEEPLEEIWLEESFMKEIEW